MNKNLKPSAQGGFTLIELIVVIVILGILAATAMPKFMNLSGEARYASLKAAKASLISTSTMAHSKWLVNPTNTITVEGVTITMENGYPNSATIAAAAGLDANDYKQTINGRNITVSPVGANAATCSVVYDNTGAATGPIITVNGTSGDNCM
ncbi:type II secretion system protein [Massilia sp. TN1-12]|uniref:type II secretion system protein n=1 Tax=Massilia paldalensis TaxID=3377675 RepID=UPI0038517B6C